MMNWNIVELNKKYSQITKPDLERESKNKMSFLVRDSDRDFSLFHPNQHFKSGYIAEPHKQLNQ